MNVNICKFIKLYQGDCTDCEKLKQLAEQYRVAKSSGVGSWDIDVDVTRLSDDRVGINLKDNYEIDDYYEMSWRECLACFAHNGDFVRMVCARKTWLEWSETGPSWSSENSRNMTSRLYGNLFT